MEEREIIGESGGNVARVNCQHCGGKGKCDCLSCRECVRVGTMVNCKMCNGYGFVLLRTDGTVIKPKPQEDKK